MYELTVEQEFDAAHALRGYQGKCERLHGHRFQVAVTVQTPKLDDIGLAYDFTRLKAHLAKVIGRFDHSSLNETPPFDTINPSSENIAATVYAELKSLLGGAPVTLVSVTVWESPQSRVVYTPDQA